MVCVAHDHVPIACWHGQFVSLLPPNITARCFILSVCCWEGRGSRVWRRTTLNSWGGGYFLSVETPAVSWPLSLPRGGRKAYSIQEDTCFWMAKPHRSGVYDRYKSRLSEQQISDLFHGSQIQRTWTLQLSTSLLQILLGTWSVRSVDGLTCSSIVRIFCIQFSLPGQSGRPAVFKEQNLRPYKRGFPEKTGWRHFAGVWPKVLLWSFHSILPSLSQLLPDVFMGKGTFTWCAYAWLFPGQLFRALELLPLIEPKDTYSLIPGRGRGFPCGSGLHDVGDNFNHFSIYWALHLLHQRLIASQCFSTTPENVMDPGSFPKRDYLRTTYTVPEVSVDSFIIKHWLSPVCFHTFILTFFLQWCYFPFQIALFLHCLLKDTVIEAHLIKMQASQKDI